MNKMIRSVVAVVALGASAFLAVPTASAAQGDCGPGYTCLWEHPNYQGGGISFKMYIPNFGTWKLTNGKPANNVASSLKNHGNSDNACVYDGANKTGKSRNVYKGTELTFLGTIGMDDMISSAYFTPKTTC